MVTQILLTQFCIHFPNCQPSPHGLINLQLRIVIVATINYVQLHTWAFINLLFMRPTWYCRNNIGMYREPLRNLPCLRETWLASHEHSQMFLLGRSPEIHFTCDFLNISMTFPSWKTPGMPRFMPDSLHLVWCVTTLSDLLYLSTNGIIDYRNFNVT